jgi:hydroxymethylbilane synthase
MRNIVKKLNHLETDWRTTCERTLLRVLEGGCSVPVGVETQFLPPARGTETDEATYLALRPLALRATIASLDGQTAIYHEVTRQIYSKQEAEALGREVAEVLIDRGGKAILEELGRIVQQKNVNGINDDVALQQKQAMDVDQSSNAAEV